MARNRFYIIAGVLMALGLSCSENDEGKSAFAGKATKLKVKATVPAGDATDQDPTLTSFSLSTPAQTSVNGKEVWAVTNDKVFRIKIDDENGNPSYPTTQWTTAFNSGARTYVTEIGLMFGRSRFADEAGHPDVRSKWEWGLFRASDQNPGVTQRVWRDEDQADESRFCVTSWKVGEQAYVGGAYFTSVGVNLRQRKFVRIPIDKTSPTGLKESEADVRSVGTADGTGWGYTCYTDQSRKWFWSNWNGVVQGVDLEKMTPLTADFVPNQNHTVDIADFTFKATEQGSYSMNGDDKGNLLSAHAKAEAGTRPDGTCLRDGSNPCRNKYDHEASYAWAYDPVSKFIFGSTWNQDKFYVTDPACFSTLTSCPVNQKHFVIPGMWKLGSVGPLSSLSDGRVAAFSRSTHHPGNPNVTDDGLSYLYFFSLKDPNNPALGLKIVKIKDIPGETYMYTDFTGATLYPADVQKVIDLSMAKGFRPGIELQTLTIKWTAESQTAEPWRGLRFSARCYAKGAATLPTFAEYAMGAATQETELPGCKGSIDKVEIKVSGSGASAGFSRTRSFELQGTQKDPEVTPTPSPTAAN